MKNTISAVRVTDIVGFKVARQLRGMTQEHIGKAVGIHQETISRIESGKMEPSVSAARRIAEVLGVPLHYLRFAAEDAPAVQPAAPSAPVAPSTFAEAVK